MSGVVRWRLTFFATFAHKVAPTPRRLLHEPDLHFNLPDAISRLLRMDLSLERVQGELVILVFEFGLSRMDCQSV